MKLNLIVIVFIIIKALQTNCYAGCNCDDWVRRNGYCVNYIKSRIPTFPIPNSIAEISNLKNKGISEVADGDVAIFDCGDFWHVSYVEKVHKDQYGNVIAIDVSEMNYGRQLSFHKYLSHWSPKNEKEWKRAVCCGVTNKYSQISFRKSIPLSTVKQIWSPIVAEYENAKMKNKDIVDKITEVFNHFFQ